MSVPAPMQPSRWWRYVKKRRIVCPAGHHIPSTFDIPESGFVRCPKHLNRQGMECGRWVFIIAIRGGSCIVAEVSPDERQEMEDLSTPAAMLDYLGILAGDVANQANSL